MLAGPIMDEDYFDAEIRLGSTAGPGTPATSASRTCAGWSARRAWPLVTPTWDEPFGLVAAEAMSAARPVAGYARGGLPEIITPETGRLAAAHDVAGLARPSTRPPASTAGRCGRTPTPRWVWSGWSTSTSSCCPLMLSARAA